MKNKIKTIALTLCCAFILGVTTACGVTGGDQNDNNDAPGPDVESTLPEVDLPPVAAPETPEQKPEELPTPPQNPVPEETPTVKKATYIQIKTNGLNVRSGPSTGALVLGQINKEASMLYLGKENGFYKTYYKNQTAYVSAKSSYSALYEKTAGEDAVEDVIKEGCKLIGTPYVYGAVRYHNGKGVKLSGFTAKKFDCSSLMQYIFYMGNGTLLQVNTRTQIYQGEYVKRADLKRGDLIFFTNDARRNKTGIERVGHVAMYLGDNLILHTASDYAKIESMSTQRWNDYIEARRMISA